MVAHAPPAPVTAPAHLLFEGVVPAPQVLWEQMKSGLGDAGRVLPKHFPLLVTELLGVSPVTSGRFETQLPIRIAVDAAPAPEGGGLGWCVAFPVTSGGELLADLTTGSRAAYHRVEHDGVIELAKPGVIEFPARGLRGNHLMLASDSRALKELAPYLATNSLESSHRARANGLMLVSRPGVGATLAQAYEVWASGEGGGWRSDWFESSLPTGSGPLARLLDAVADQVSSGLVQTLGSVNSSKLELYVEGEWVKLHGVQQGPIEWQSVPQACDVVSQAPLDVSTASLAWGGSQRVELSVTSRAGEGAALRGPFLLGVGQLELGTDPATGVSRQADVAYADVGWAGHVASPTAQEWLEGLVSESEFSLSRIDGQGAARAKSASAKLSTSPDAPPEFRSWAVRAWSESQQASVAVAELVLSATTPERGRFWVGPGVADVLTGRGGRQVTSRHAWSEHCEHLMFGVSVGHGGSQVSLWAARSTAGFDMHGAVPLRALRDL